MPVSQEQIQDRILSITTYYTEPAYPNAIEVSAHASLDETRQAILSAIQPTTTQDGEPLSADLSSIIIAFGEFFFKTYSPLPMNSFAAYEANTPLGQVASENILAIIPTDAPLQEPIAESKAEVVCLFHKVTCKAK